MTGRQRLQIMKEISRRYSPEETRAMSRQEFLALINEIGKELYPED